MTAPNQPWLFNEVFTQLTLVFPFLTNWTGDGLIVHTSTSNVGWLYEINEQNDIHEVVIKFSCKDLLYKSDTEMLF